MSSKVRNRLERPIAYENVKNGYREFDHSCTAVTSYAIVVQWSSHFPALPEVVRSNPMGDERLYLFLFILLFFLLTDIKKKFTKTQRLPLRKHCVAFQ